MLFSKPFHPSFPRTYAWLASLTMGTLLSSFGCHSDPQEPSGDEESQQEKDKPKKEEKGEKDSKNKDEENPSGSKPSEKAVEFKLDGDPIDKKNLRIVVHPEVADGEHELKLGKVLVDIPAKFKDGIAKVTIPPVPESTDLGDEQMTTLLTTIYQDKDESESYSKEDVILASVLEIPVYSRPSNPAGDPEWQHMDMNTGRLAPITRPLEIVRLDDNTQVESITYQPKVSNIAENIGAVATISQEELANFSENFQEAPRVLSALVERDKERQTLTLGSTPDKARQSDKLPNYLPKFGKASLSFLGGFEQKDAKITKDSKYAGLGCILMSSADEVDPIYQIVANLWIETNENWVTDPQAAFETVIMGYLPGWNAVGIQVGDDGSIYASPLLEEDFEVLRFDDKCTFKVKELEKAL